MITVQGQIVSGAGAQDGCCGDLVPVVAIKFSQTIPDGAKAFGRQTVNSAIAFVPITGVGPTGSVTQGLFLYLKTAARFMIRVTQKGTTSLDPDIVSTFPLQGMLMMEFPLENTLKLLEVEGVGPVDFLVGGNS